MSLTNLEKTTVEVKQLEAKLAELRAVQEAQLESLSKRGVNMDYENKAEYDLDTNDLGTNPFDEIEVDPAGAGVADESDGEESAKDRSGRSLVFAEPIVIE